ncbi:MAG TPA: hypothetical protein VMT27_09120 [Actinomycetes bacterium]|nr:hypothetical protein [Actinomycetes bacterium]
MTALIHAAESVTKEEVSGFPHALTMGISVFVSFAILLFIITRLNPDR